MDHRVYKEGKKPLKEGYFLDKSYFTTCTQIVPSVNVLVGNGSPTSPLETDSFPQKGRKIIVLGKINIKILLPNSIFSVHLYSLQKSEQITTLVNI
jgi:hypothetical protein